MITRGHHNSSQAQASSVCFYDQQIYLVLDHIKAVQKVLHHYNCLLGESAPSLPRTYSLFGRHLHTLVIITTITSLPTQASTSLGHHNWKAAKPPGRLPIEISLPLPVLLKRPGQGQRHLQSWLKGKGFRGMYRYIISTHNPFTPVNRTLSNQ